MSNDHHHPDPMTEQITNIVMQTCKSAELRNHSIGTTMEHIGSALSISATQYLPITADEVLVQPEIYDNSHSAIVLTNRTVRSHNSGALMVSWVVIDNRIEFDVVGFQINDFYLDQTKFLKFTPEEEAEISRQLRVMLAGVTDSGNVIFNYTHLNNYFPAVAAG